MNFGAIIVVGFMLFLIGCVACLKLYTNINNPSSITPFR